MYASPVELPICSLLQRRGGPLSDPPLSTRRSSAATGLSRVLDASTPGLLLDFYLLTPYVVLDDLRVLHYVLADADLFLDHRALAYNDLFLGHRHHNLVLTDLGLRSLAFYGHPLHAYLLVAGRDLYVLAVCTNTLTDLQLTGLALAGACGELFLCPLHPELVLVFEVGAIGHARRLGSLLGVVALIGAAALGRGAALEAVVGIDLVLELRRDLPVIVEGGAVLGRGLVGRDGDRPSLVVGGAYRLPRDEGAPRPEEAHLDAYILGLVALVHEEVIYLADLLARWVVDLVSGVPILQRREPVAALFHDHASLQAVFQRHPRSGAWSYAGWLRPYPTASRWKTDVGVAGHMEDASEARGVANCVMGHKSSAVLCFGGLCRR